MSQETISLEELLNRIRKADSEGDKVSLDAILDEVGYRSFGPLILVSRLGYSCTSHRGYTRSPDDYGFIGFVDRRTVAISPRTLLVAGLAA